MRRTTSNMFGRRLHTTCALVAFLAGACVDGIEPVDEEGLSGYADDTDGADDGPDDGNGDAVDRATPEHAEPDRVSEVDEQAVGLIAAGSGHTWTLTILNGNTGSLSDFGDGDAPDLYVKRFCANQYRNKTQVVNNSTRPIWNRTLLSAFLSNAYMRTCYIELWDADANGHDYGGRVSLGQYVDEMTRYGLSSIIRQTLFTADDDTVVYIKLQRD